MCYTVCSTRRTWGSKRRIDGRELGRGAPVIDGEIGGGGSEYGSESELLDNGDRYAGGDGLVS